MQIATNGLQIFQGSEPPRGSASTWMLIRSQLFTLTRIRIQLPKIMRIRIQIRNPAYSCLGLSRTLSNLARKEPFNICLGQESQNVPHHTDSPDLLGAARSPPPCVLSDCFNRVSVAVSKTRYILSWKMDYYSTCRTKNTDPWILVEWCGQHSTVQLSGPSPFI